MTGSPPGALGPALARFRSPRVLLRRSESRRLSFREDVRKTTEAVTESYVYYARICVPPLVTPKKPQPLPEVNRTTAQENNSV
jgi:hypothetical protein